MIDGIHPIITKRIVYKHFQLVLSIPSVSSIGILNYCLLGRISFKQNYFPNHSRELHVVVEHCVTCQYDSWFIDGGVKHGLTE